MKHHGLSEVRYPRMDEGFYRVCLVDENRRRETLENGFLPPAGTLELALEHAD